MDIFVEVRTSLHTIRKIQHQSASQTIFVPAQAREWGRKGSLLVYVLPKILWRIEEARKKRMDCRFLVWSPLVGRGFAKMTLEDGSAVQPLFHVYDECKVP